MEKKEYSRNRINKLKEISRELEKSFGNCIKTDKEIANIMLEIVTKQKRIYSDKINLLKTKTIEREIPLECMDKFLNNRLKNYNREKRKKQKKQIVLRIKIKKRKV